MEVIKGDLFESRSDAIVLTIYGSAAGMEGNLARHFGRKWLDAWEEVQDEMIYPLGLGEVSLIALDEQTVCDHRHVIIASTLHHKDTLSSSEIRHVVRSAFVQSIHTASTNRIATLSTAVMTGGWRLKTGDAFRCMIDAYKSVEYHIAYNPTVRIHTTSHEDFKLFAEIAKERGLLRGFNENALIIG